MNNLNDKALIKKRFAKHLASYESQAAVQREIAEELARKILSLLPESCEKLMEIGCGTGLLTRALLEKIRIQTLYLNDLVEEAVDLTAEKIMGAYSGTERIRIPGDAEAMPLPSALSGVVSASTLQWFDDLPAFFRKVHQHLTPGGCLGFNLFGPENLYQIKDLTGIGLDYPSPKELTSWLEYGFEKTEISEQWIHPQFDSPLDILRHLQQTGVTGTGRFRWTRESLRNFEQNYREQFSLPDGKVVLTWHVLYVTAKKT